MLSAEAAKKWFQTANTIAAKAEAASRTIKEKESAVSYIRSQMDASACQAINNTESASIWYGRIVALASE
jgi:hypothetical protein